MSKKPPAEHRKAKDWRDVFARAEYLNILAHADHFIEACRQIELHPESCADAWLAAHPSDDGGSKWDVRR